MPDGAEKRGPIIFERRKFLRVDGTYVVSYRDISAEIPKGDVTQTKNISVGGILFTTGRSFAAGAILAVGLRLPGSLDYINIQVKVVESKHKGKGKSIMYDTRVKFIDLKETDSKYIQKIIGHRLQNRKNSK